ncbi:MAG: hypothetical protein ACLGIG_10130 [Actinomycetes bacterium]
MPVQQDERRAGAHADPDEPPAPDRWRWPARLVPALVLVALGGSLVARRESLWYDELYTARVGTAGLGRLLEAVVTGTGTTSYLADVPPSYNAPYYVVVHAWLALPGVSADDLGLRLLSLLSAAAAVAVLVAAVQRLADRAVALAAGLLAATSPLVVEYSAEARMYGLAVLATSTALLGLARWLDGCRGSLALYGAGAAAAGLLHWFTLPVLGALAVAALVLRGRRALPVLGVTVVAAVPTAVLVALLAVNGTGTSAVGAIPERERPVPVLALEAWTGGSAVLLVAVLAAVVLAGVRVARGRGLRPVAVVAGLWLVLPLAAVWAGDALRPLFVPRYLLATLLALAVLAAIGTAGGRGRVPLTAGLAVLSVLAALPLLDREPREPAAEAVAALERVHRAGEPVVAVDRRAALALDHYASPQLRTDLRVPPEDAPPEARTVWLLRQATGLRVRHSDDDDLLSAAGLRVTSTRVFEGYRSDFVLQRWS